MFSEESADSSLAMDTAVGADTATSIGSIDTPEASTDAAQENVADSQAEESFDSLIKGKYKSDYDAKIKEAIDKRFKNQKDNGVVLDRLEPLFRTLQSKYGLAGNLDVDALVNAIENDNSLYEQEAFQKGIDVETLKQMKRLEAENTRLKALDQARMQDEAQREQYNKLIADAEAVKAIYPGFDLDAEMSDPDFGRLVSVGIPMQTAYEVKHKDQIMSNAMQYAVNRTASNLSASIQSGMKRPTENGTSAMATTSSAGTLDPSHLSAKDFAELKRRAERGERISFV